MGKGSGRRDEDKKHTRGYGDEYDRIFGPGGRSYQAHLSSTYTQLFGGRVLRHHDANRCSGEHCSIHNPSDHPLKDQPLHWREDRYPPLMERICKHGVGHPDPDHLAHIARTQGDEAARLESVHGCDGCCYRK